MTVKPTTQTRVTHDWESLKTEFMAGPWLEVFPFVRQRLGNRGVRLSGAQAKMTKGWSKEKVQRKQAMRTRILEASEKRQEKTLQQALELVRSELVRRSEGAGTLSIKEIDALWSILRTESGMPTTITKNENRNHDDTALEKQGLSDLLIKAKDANDSGQLRATNQA